MRKFEFIDSLRGVAILMVIIVHCSQYGRNYFPVIISNVFNLGLTGVQLFFIISAFTIFYSLNNRKSDQETSNLQFFIRRYFRIAPMYYIGIFYYLIQDGLGDRYWLGDQSHITVSNVLSNLTFTHGFYPYHINSIVPGGWTIAVEMIFYCLVPFLFSYITSLWRAIFGLGASILVKVIFYKILIENCLIIDVNLWNEFLSIYIFSQLPYFFMGILLYYIFVKKYGNLPILILSGIILICLPFFSRKGLVIDPRFLMGLIFLLLAYILSQKPIKILVNPIFSFFGKISFSMYIVHFAVLHWLNHFGIVDFLDIETTSSIFLKLGNFTIRYTVVLVTTGAISYLTFITIEQPFQNIAKIIINRIPKGKIELVD